MAQFSHTGLTTLIIMIIAGILLAVGLTYLAQYKDASLVTPSWVFGLVVVGGLFFVTSFIIFLVDMCRPRAISQGGVYAIPEAQANKLISTNMGPPLGTRVN